MTSRPSFIPTRLKTFGIQWHITTRCQLHCQHCYITDKERQIGDLPLEKNIEIADNCINTLKKWGLTPYFAITGGDPLLYKDIDYLVKYLRNRNIKVALMGNPFLITKARAIQLKRMGILHYQLSLDGLRETHDTLRNRKGLFDLVLNTIDILNQVGLESVIMCTVSKLNYREIPALMELLAKRRLTCFSFARLVPCGHGKDLEKYLFSPQEYRKFLITTLRKEYSLRKKGYTMNIFKKDHLWELLAYEYGGYRYNLKNTFIGCGMGTRHIGIMTNGTVLVCRRMNLIAGSLLDSSLEDIFLHHPNFKRVRNWSLYKKCKSCKLINICRGCPAVAYGLTGNFYNPDPQCWKEVKL